MKLLLRVEKDNLRVLCPSVQTILQIHVVCIFSACVFFGYSNCTRKRWYLSSKLVAKRHRCGFSIGILVNPKVSHLGSKAWRAYSLCWWGSSHSFPWKEWGIERQSSWDSLSMALIHLRVLWLPFSLYKLCSDSSIALTCSKTFLGST